MLSVYAISRWRDRWDRFEAIVGLLACFAVAFGPLTIAGFTLLFAVLCAEWRLAAVAGAITSVTCPMAVWLARMAGHALAEFRTEGSSLPSLPDDRCPQARIPFAIVLASFLPRLPPVARAPLGVWWLAHFLAGTALVVFADVLAQQGVLWKVFANGFAAIVFAYWFHVAANVFLVLAVMAAFQSPRVTACVWRARFAIDGVCILPLLLWVIL
jgi:hypothetical protein